jgi:hypothetical protein
MVQRAVQLHTDRLPPPAVCPRTQPSRPVWSHLKRSLAKRNLSQLTTLVKTRLKRMQYRPSLLDGFPASTGLDFTPLRGAGPSPQALTTSQPAHPA